MRPNKGGVLLFGLWLAVPAQAAEDVTLLASVDVRSLGVDDQVPLTVSVSGRSLGGLDNPGVPPLKNLRVVGGPFTSTQVSFVNGAVSQSKTFAYVLQPLAVGKAEVGSLHLKLPNGEERSTSPIMIDVVQGSVRPPPQRRADPFGWDPFGQDPFGEDPFESLLGRGRRGARPMRAPKLFVEASANRAKVYVGEPVRLVYQLYTQTAVTDLQFAEPAKYPGFWAEDIARPAGGIRGTAVTVEGEPYQRFTVVEKQLFPTKGGKLTIPAARLRVSLARESVFSGLPAAVERTTKPVTVEVAPLPEIPGFSGAVGQYRASAAVDRSSVPLGEAVTLRVTLTGRGNLKWIERGPEVRVPGAKVYPPQTKDSITVDASGMSGSRTWEHVIVPETSGALPVPALSFVYFDPASGATKRAETAPLVVDVLGGTAPGGAPAAVTSLRPAQSPSGLALRTELEAGERSWPALTPRTLVVLALGAGLLHLALWGWPRVQAARWRHANPRRPARVSVRAALAEVEKLRRGGKGKEAAARAIEKALTDVFGPLDGPLDGDGERAARAVLDEVRFLRYAPQLGDYSEKIREVAGRAAEVLRRHG